MFIIRIFPEINHPANGVPLMNGKPIHLQCGKLKNTPELPGPPPPSLRYPLLVKMTIVKLSTIANLDLGDPVHPVKKELGSLYSHLHSSVD